MPRANRRSRQPRKERVVMVGAERVFCDDNTPNVNLPSSTAYAMSAWAAPFSVVDMSLSAPPNTTSKARYEEIATPFSMPPSSPQLESATVESTSREGLDLFTLHTINSAPSRPRVKFPGYQPTIVVEASTCNIFAMEEDILTTPTVNLPYPKPDFKAPLPFLFGQNSARKRKSSNGSGESSPPLSENTEVTIPATHDTAEIHFGDVCVNYNGTQKVVLRFADVRDEEETEVEHYIECDAGSKMSEHDVVKWLDSFDDEESKSGSEISAIGAADAADVPEQIDTPSIADDEHHPNTGGSEVEHGVDAQADFDEPAQCEKLGFEDDSEATTPELIHSDLTTEVIDDAPSQSNGNNFPLCPFMGAQIAPSTSWADMMEDDPENDDDPRVTAAYRAYSGVSSGQLVQTSEMEDDLDEVIVEDAEHGIDTEKRQGVDANGDTKMTDSVDTFGFEESSRSKNIASAGNADFDLLSYLSDEPILELFKQRIRDAGWTAIERHLAANSVIAKKHLDQVKIAKRQELVSSWNVHWNSTICDGDDPAFDVREYVDANAGWGLGTWVAKPMTMTPEEFLWATSKFGICADFSAVTLREDEGGDYYRVKEIACPEARAYHGTTFYENYEDFESFQGHTISIKDDTNRRFCLLRGTMLDFAAYSPSTTGGINWSAAQTNVQASRLRLTRAPLVTGSDAIESATEAGVSFRVGYCRRLTTSVCAWKEEINSLYPQGRTLEAVHDYFGRSKLNQVMCIDDEEEEDRIDDFYLPSSPPTCGTPRDTFSSPLRAPERLCDIFGSDEGIDGSDTDGPDTDDLEFEDVLPEEDGDDIDWSGYQRELEADMEDDDPMLFDTSEIDDDQAVQDHDSEVCVVDSIDHLAHDTVSLDQEEPFLADEEGWEMLLLSQESLDALDEAENVRIIAMLEEMVNDHTAPPESIAAVVAENESPVDCLSERLQQAPEIVEVDTIRKSELLGFGGSFEASLASTAADLDAASASELLLDLLSWTNDCPISKNIDTTTCPGGWVEDENHQGWSIGDMAKDLAATAWKHRSLLFLGCVAGVVAALW